MTRTDSKTSMYMFYTPNHVVLAVGKILFHVLVVRTIPFICATHTPPAFGAWGNGYLPRYQSISTRCTRVHGHLLTLRNM
eukprot:246258-Amorphochlora_amoeboformis.AAC.1